MRSNSELWIANPRRVQDAEKISDGVAQAAKRVGNGPGVRK
jgi:hypothetical protein